MMPTMLSATSPPRNDPSLRRSPRKGAATVEFAFAFTILVLLIFAGIEITRVSSLRHTVDHAAYLAARVAIVPGVDAAEVIARAEAHLGAVGIVGASVSVTPAVIEDDTTVVEVQVTMPIAANSFITPQFVTGNLIGRSALMTERSPMQMSANLPEPPPPPPPPPSDPEDPPPPGDDDDDDDDGGPADPPPPPPPPPPTL